MTVRVSTAMHTAAIAAAGAAANGAKNAAFSGSIQTALGANPVVKLVRTGSTVASKALSGSLPVVDNAFKISAAAWADSTTAANADIDTGTWVIRVEKAADAAVYLESDLGKVGSGKPFLLSGDVEDALGVSQQDLYFQCPSFDVTSAVVTDVQTCIDDMGEANEVVASLPYTPGWNTTTGRGGVIMGTIPSGNRLPDWAKEAVFDEWETSTYWAAFIHWWVLFEMAGNSATNTRVEFRYPRVYLEYNSSPTWQLFDGANSPGFFRASKTNIMAIPGALEEIVNSSGNKEVYLPPNSDFVIHGIGDKKVINPFNLKCVHTRIQARLAIRNTALADDRANARLCIHNGGDFYPNNSVTPQEVGEYFPGIGYGRMKRVTTAWRAFTFTTLTNGEQNYNAAQVSEEGRSGVAAISPAAFSLNPPPMN